MNYISILFVLFMFLYACTDENIINDASGRIPEAPEGKANIAVKFQSGSFNKPVTKATIHNDGDFDNPWVLSLNCRPEEQQLRMLFLWRLYRLNK